MALRESVQAAVAEVTDPRDRGTVELALTYAGALDDTGPECDDCGRSGGDLAKLGPPLLAALEALQLSPRARAAAKKAVTNGDKPASRLDQLASRRARKGGAAPVDTTPARPEQRGRQLGS